MFNPVKVKCEYLDGLAFQMSFWCCEIEQISQSQDEFLKADKEETRKKKGTPNHVHTIHACSWAEESMPKRSVS